MTHDAASGFDVCISVIDSKTGARDETRAFPSGTEPGISRYCGVVALDDREMHWVHLSFEKRVRIIGGSKPSGEKHALAAAFDHAVELVDQRAAVAYRVKDRFDVTVTIGPREKRPQLVRTPMAASAAPRARIPKAPVQKNQMDQLLTRLKDDRPAGKPAKKPEGAVEKLGAFMRAIAAPEAPTPHRIVKVDERALRRTAGWSRR